MERARESQHALREAMASITDRLRNRRSFREWFGTVDFLSHDGLYVRPQSGARDLVSHCGDCVQSGGTSS
jgi:hypothetical protein